MSSHWSNPNLIQGVSNRVRINFRSHSFMFSKQDKIVTVILVTINRLNIKSEASVFVTYEEGGWKCALLAMLGYGSGFLEKKPFNEASRNLSN